MYKYETGECWLFEKFKGAECVKGEIWGTFASRPDYVKQIADG
jgi:hypothetical protein